MGIPPPPAYPINLNASINNRNESANEPVSIPPHDLNVNQSNVSVNADPNVEEVIPPPAVMNAAADAGPAAPVHDLSPPDVGAQNEGDDPIVEAAVAAEVVDEAAAAGNDDGNDDEDFVPGEEEAQDEDGEEGVDIPLIDALPPVEDLPFVAMAPNEITMRGDRRVFSILPGKKKYYTIISSFFISFL